MTLVRLRLAATPLERDEGEYAYAGQLLLDGVPPYSLAYNMKFPGTYYAYAILMKVFGQTVWGVHAGLLLVNLASVVLLFQIARRWFGAIEGAAAALLFAILAVDPGVLGFSAHASHFVVLAVLGGFAVLGAPSIRGGWRIAAAGACFGAAIAMSQQGVFFAPAGLLIAVCPPGGVDRSQRRRRAAWFIGGLLVPLVLLVVVPVVQGVASTAEFWTIAYARAYVSEVSWRSAWALFANSWIEVTRSTLAIWALAGAGFIALCVSSQWRGRRRLLIGLLVAGGCAMLPGLYFRRHYFVLVLPAVSLLGGIAIALAARWRPLMKSMNAMKMAALLIVTVSVAMPEAMDASYLVSTPPEGIVRQTYAEEPFVEAQAVASYVRDHTQPDDRIAVLGSEPEIYFYAHRKSATGFIYMYPLLERQPYAGSMQLEMIDEIQSARPVFLVVASVTNSWFNGLYDNLRVQDWTQRYATRCYDLVGMADLGRPGGPQLVWDDEAREFRPQSSQVIYTYRRKSAAACREPLER